MRVWLVVALWAWLCGAAGAAVTASATFIDEVQLGDQEDPNLVVFRSNQDEAWQAAVAGMDLGPGDSVWVKSGASAVVKVGGTAVMHLESDTVFTIPADAADDNGAVRKVGLESGSAWTTVEKLVNGQTFVVATKDAVGGVKGTQFHTSVGADGSSDWDMEEGKLELAGNADGGKRVMLGDGQNFRYMRGRRAFDFPRPAGERLKGLKQQFQQRFGTQLPNKAQVRQMLMQRSRTVARPTRRGMLQQRRNEVRPDGVRTLRNEAARPLRNETARTLRNEGVRPVKNDVVRPAAVRRAVVNDAGFGNRRLQNGGARGFGRPAGRRR